ncbi:iron-containing alcohol dehydrogenase [Enterovibrio sp. ZSDZ35]|uniref:Iron-containing alcohol dehydrogenase n=1 Tax=Enterovibrio qingdaonensis TaxID=2899818 RepID=A0ABT5QIT2_9GAMM|nr:iron-containing alcohol dehydrogenase [Enterovibrio sp. ZSDZ35]MDD1780891.1 iron-containing alcohol dehydrogenase [Enterovibrio sp. ZSDZ35]
MSVSIWNYPTSMSCGVGALNQLPTTCESLGIKRPLIVTDPGIAALPMTEHAQSLCAHQGLSVGLFSDVQGNPTGANVLAGNNAFLDGNHDGVIALGGGSALDCAKAIALSAKQTVPLWDFEDIGDNWTAADASKIAPVIALPTTAGTGSEVGRASVITNEDEKRKIIIFHPDMLPKQVILDPELTLGLPPHITAATGMDALSHSLEALCSPSYHPMAEGIAIEGIRLVNNFLPVVFQNGSDRYARMQMLVASSMGATAFQKGLGAMHAIAHSLGARYNAHHGLLNAILMPYVLNANRTKIEEKMTRLSSYLALEGTGTDAVLHWVLSLRASLGIPHTLSEIGIDDSEAALIGDMAVKDPSAGGNPIAFTSDQYSQIFSDAVHGKGL